MMPYRFLVFFLNREPAVMVSQMIAGKGVEPCIHIINVCQSISPFPKFDKYILGQILGDRGNFHVCDEKLIQKISVCCILLLHFYQFLMFWLWNNHGPILKCCRQYRAIIK